MNKDIKKLSNEQLIMLALADLVRSAHSHDLGYSSYKKLQNELEKRGEYND